MEQVITIHPDGGISGLQRKKGKGVDLRQFGHAHLERASEITWNEAQQCWHVHVLNEAACEWMAATRERTYRGEGGCTLMAFQWVGTISIDEPKGSYRTDGFLAFDDYDDAVAAEVAFLDALRRMGVF